MPAASVRDSSAPAAAAVTVALTTPVDTSHAPWPRNAGERLLFAQLYEPLVRIDCTGSVVPALAKSWHRTTVEGTPTGQRTMLNSTPDMQRTPADGTPAAGNPPAGVARLTFTLRHDARFANGDGVRAADVLASWRSSADAHAHDPVAPLISAIASAARALDDSTLVVELPDSLADPRSLASPYLAVSRPAPPGERWPLGTTSYDVDPALDRRVHDSSATRSMVATIGLRRRSGLEPSRASPPSDTSPLFFDVEPDADSRDILDRGADVLITSSPTTIQYALTQGHHAAVALPWSRRYVLVLPARDADRVATDSSCPDDELRPLRDALAVAVHADARGADGPCWWATGAGAAAPRVGPRPSSRRIIYQSQDPTARELAERIVALTAPGRDEPAALALREAAPELFDQGAWSASGADSARFAESLAGARDGGYILAVPSDPAWPAAARASLHAALPWLAPSVGSRALIPLVDTRETLLIRPVRGIPPVTIQHDGTVIFDPAASARVPNASDGSTP